jgi:hypothetical protein
MTLRTTVLSAEELDQFATGDLLRVAGRGPKNRRGDAFLALRRVIDRTEAEAKFGEAWNAYVFARGGMAPGAGMAVVPEPAAWEALGDAFRELTHEWDER